MNFNGGDERGRGQEQREPEPYDTSGQESGSGGLLGRIGGIFNGGGTGSRRSSGGGSSGGGDGNWGKALLAVAIIGFILWLIFSGFRSNGFISFQRIAGMPQENLDKMLNSVGDLETVNKREGKYDEVYDKNALLDDSKYLGMPEKEYLVYIYTGDKEKDKVFNEFVKSNQKEIPTYKYKFNKVDVPSLKHQIEGTVKPYIFVIVDMGKSAKVIHAVIDKEAQVGNLKEYFEDVKAQNYFKQTEENYKVDKGNENSKSEDTKNTSTKEEAEELERDEEGNIKVDTKGYNDTEEDSKENTVKESTDKESTDKETKTYSSEELKLKKQAEEYEKLMGDIEKAENK